VYDGWVRMHTIGIRNIAYSLMTSINPLKSDLFYKLSREEKNHTYLIDVLIKFPTINLCVCTQLFHYNIYITTVLIYARVSRKLNMLDRNTGLK
jgi:hypothetical protein